jgi:hypothetical protein
MVLVADGTGTTLSVPTLKRTSHLGENGVFKGRGGVSAYWPSGLVQRARAGPPASHRVRIACVREGALIGVIAWFRQLPRSRLPRDAKSRRAAFPCFRLLQILWRRLASFATGAAVIFRMAAYGSSPIGAEVG